MEKLMLFLFLLTAWSFQGSLLASDPISKEEIKRLSSETESDAYVKGSSFQSESETYQFLPELYSVVDKQDSTDSAVSGSASIQKDMASTLVKEKGPFRIYRSALTDEKRSMTFRELHSRLLFPVVLNNRTGNLGIVTGMINVKVEDINDARSIAADFNLVLHKAYSHIKTVFFTVSAGQDIIEQTESLGKDPRVISASIEVLEHLQVAH